jgi:multiple sugar transport system ATP-binding protein
MAEVSLQRISKLYPGEKRKGELHKAIDDVSFIVKDKEFMVLVGPSGCGKSTLLRMIAGLEEISDGDLLIDGNRVNDLDPRERDIAMVFQNYALYPHMTVYENMAFGLRLRRFSRKEIKERVVQTAKLLELETELYRKPKTLSGGQRQRVAIGRAIIRRPKVFLFDEPLSNLDAKLRSQMRIELQKLHREINATMIYVTHDQVEAMTLGDRIVVLNKGKLMQLNTPLYLYDHPANKFVAGFIGSPPMNFINGSIQMNDGCFFIPDSEIFKIQIDGNALKALQRFNGEKIQMGIRPEHIVLDTNGIDSHADCLGEINAYENMGNEQLLYLTLGNQTLIVRRPQHETIQVGNEKGIHFLREKIMYINSSNDEIIAVDL